MAETQADRLYSVGEAAHLLDIPRHSLQYLLETGRINEPAQRVAGRRLFTIEEIEKARLIIKNRSKTP